MRKVITYNRKASHDYFLEERFEAGLVLQGTEIKAIRKGHAQLKDAYISFKDGEAYIKMMHVPPYEFGNRFNHDETRDRKLLLHKSEIQKLTQKVKLNQLLYILKKVWLSLRLLLRKGKIFMTSVMRKKKKTQNVKLKKL